MPLILVLNAILCCAVLVMVITPLIWAIRTQHRDAPVPNGSLPRVRSAHGRGLHGPRERHFLGRTGAAT
jgi:hypothetical protein